MKSDPPSAVDEGERVVPGSTRARRFALVACTLAWSFACASPGLFGSWVYDDNRMLDNPVYDGWDDVPAVFTRTALDYLVTPNSTEVTRGSETYRPVTMFVLVLTHVIAESALLHHLVGWLLHVALAGVLLLVLQRTLRRAGEPVGVTPWCLATVFLLHPIGVEAYVWINGRSDVMAGLFVTLAALVALVAGSDTSRPHVRPSCALICIAAFVTSALATASKETALGALVGVWVAALVQSRQQGDTQPPTRTLSHASIAAGAGVVAYLLAWYAVQEGGFADPGRGGPILADAATRNFVPKLLAIGAGSLLSLEASPMQSFAWLAFRPLTPIEWLGAALALVFVGHLLWTRDWRGLALVGGAVLTLLPTVVLIRSLWLGRDRYLYVPLILLLIAAAPAVARAVRQRSERLRWLPGVAFGVILLGASASTATASSYYANQLTWMTSGLRPETGDPTRYVFAADELIKNRNSAGAAAFLAEMPPPPWPLVVSIGVLNVAHALGDRALYEQVLDDTERAYPESVEPRIHRLHQRMLAGEVEAALAMVPALAADEYCSDVESVLRHAGTSASLTEHQRQAVEAAYRRLPCLAAGAR